MTYIRQFAGKNGFAPSVREIGAAVNIASTSTVHGYLKRLENAGYLWRDSAKPRAMVVIKDQGALSPGHILLEERLKPGSGHSEKPFSSETLRCAPFIPFQRLLDPFSSQDAAAGKDEPLSWYLPPDAAESRRHIITCMPDDSMINRQIHAGDYLIVKRQDSAANSDVVVGSLQQEILIRTYFKGLRQVRLQAENDAIEPRMADQQDFMIFGVVTGCLHMF